ncbi:hypothetical protein WICMUC_002737 [Wickerhamomyces mucosus]|uniref:Cyclin-like domain-containing protein n=1 Tax=Wickerhamomyces mucosus TaxID=1378264 RepID=A0A9P8PNA8_9ASCO|nr:hypothetical protein WICMUC_002737 [Wickerhamomyces mucosus]
MSSNETISTWSPKLTNLGPPKHIKPRLYHPTLELLERAANEKYLTEYEQDIYNDFSYLENVNSSINCSMIDLQPEIQWFMRPYLLDFLLDVHNSLRLQPQTLFLSVFIMDNYCSKRVVFKKHYQLVGVVALWIASKYEDKKSRVPTLKELTMMCRNVYDQDMFVQMERHVLSTLDWNLQFTSLEDCLQICLKNTKSFILESTPQKIDNKYLNQDELHLRIEEIARFLTEISLYERNFLQFPNSLISIAAHLLASHSLNSRSALDSFEVSISKFYKQQQENFDNLQEDFSTNDENELPDIIIPFLSGWNEDESIDCISKILIMFIITINNLQDLSKVLMDKYSQVISLLENFLSKFDHLLKHLPQQIEAFDNHSELRLDVNQLRSCHVLLGLVPDSQPQQPLQSVIPMTPVSATSSTYSSIFSDNNFSNISLPPSSPMINSSKTCPQEGNTTGPAIFKKPKLQINEPSNYPDFKTSRYNQDTIENSSPDCSPLAQRSQNKLNMQIS